MPHSHSLEYHTQKLLAYGERVFKTDLRFLIKGGVWSTIGAIATSGSALVLSLALSRWIPKEAYGDYKYALAFIAVLGAFCLNGFSTAVFQSTASGFGKSLPEGFRSSLMWSFLVFIGAITIGGYYLFHGNTSLGIGILVGGSLTPFLISSNLYNSFLVGKKDFRRQTLYGMVGTIIPALCILITAYFYPTALALILSYFISNTVVTLALYYYTLRQYHAEKELHDPGMKRYAWHQSAMGILSTFTGNIDQLFLYHFVGGVDVAIYAFAIGVLDQSKGPLKSFDNMLQSRFATQKTRSIRESMHNKIFWLFIFLLIVVVAYIVAAPLIYHILFPAYSSAVPYSQVYALSLLGMATGPTGSYLSAKKKVKAQYVSTILNSLFQIFVIIGGVFLFGLWGLIWARVIIRVAGGIVSYILYEQAVRTELAIS